MSPYYRPAYRNAAAGFERFENLVTEVLHIPVQHFFLLYLGMALVCVHLILLDTERRAKKRFADSVDKKVDEPALSKKENFQFAIRKHYLIITGITLALLSCIPL